ncbi:MAG: hypothetical protein IPG39_07985 [Bacteroidetes bacterium]|nr:hypothetical protein [Bacteroidota bacterium]
MNDVTDDPKKSNANGILTVDDQTSALMAPVVPAISVHPVVVASVSVFNDPGYAVTLVA